MTPLSLFHPQEGRTCQFSPDRFHRYALERRWGKGPFIMFIGLNPSTADEERDDPTIRRCVGYAKAWGAGGLLMGNLFAWRATDPRELRTAWDPVGPDNDAWLSTMCERSIFVVCAWGANPLAPVRAEHALFFLDPRKTRCLGRTKSGQPRHPLYLAKDLVPEVYWDERVPVGAR